MEDTFGNEQMQSDWDAALRRQNEERVTAEQRARDEQMASAIDENRAVFDNYVQIHRQTAMERQRRNRRGAANLLSAFKIGALYNGGMAPEDMMPGLNDALGFDGKTRAIYALQALPNGDVKLSVASKDQQSGQIVNENPIVLPFKQIYGMALETPGILTRDELMRLRNNSITTQKLTDDMANRDLPPVPENYGVVQTPVGGRTEAGGTSVNPNWLYGPQRRSAISAFGANGRGGFTRYDANADTDYQLQQEDRGTRAADNKGNWKLLSVGADPKSDDGTQIRRYENTKTGEVVSVRDGERAPWETSGLSEKERIARINADGKVKAAEKANEAKMSLANAANELKKYGIDVSAQLKERGLDIQQQNADERSAHNQATEEQNAENEKGRNDRAKQANETKARLAEMKSGGTMGGRQPTAHEYVEVMKLAGDRLQSEETRGQARELGSLIADSLKKRGEKVPEVTQSGKAEVKTGDNGSGNGRQFKEGDVQEINGIKMKLLPSKKNPGKLTWQRV